MVSTYLRFIINNILLPHPGPHPFILFSISGFYLHTCIPVNYILTTKGHTVTLDCIKSYLTVP